MKYPIKTFDLFAALTAEEMEILQKRLAKLKARPPREGMRERRRNEKIWEIETKIALASGSTTCKPT